jgi:hypothetical protein
VWPGRPTGFGRALSGESQGLFDERSPRVGQGWGDGGPLAEPAACGGEWLAVARLEQFGDAGLLSLTSRCPVRRSHDAKNWPLRRRQGSLIMVEDVTPG